MTLERSCPFCHGGIIHVEAGHLLNQDGTLHLCSFLCSYHELPLSVCHCKPQKGRPEFLSRQNECDGKCYDSPAKVYRNDVRKT